MTEDYAKVQEIWNDLLPNAREVLGSLFLNGPLYDGMVPSKMGRDELYDKGLIDRGFGWQWLTKEGVSVCVFAKVENWFDGRWRKKQQS